MRGVKEYIWHERSKASVATPLWPSVGVKPNTPKVGDLESSGTPECLRFNSKAQNTLHWRVLVVIGKVLKRRYRKLPCIVHLDICNPSYGQKKGRESNWQFDSRPLKVGNRPLPNLRIESARCSWKRSQRGLQLWFRPCRGQTLRSRVMSSRSPGTPTGTISGLQLGSPGKKCHSSASAAEWHRVYYKEDGGGTSRVRAVVCLMVQSARGLSQHPRVFPNVN
jgi:hypothetical protein